MAMQNGLPNNDSPPFATSGGSPSVNSGGGGGTHMPKDRPQSEARPECEPSPAEIPAGGKVLLADPTGSAGQSGAVVGVNGETPFKNLR
jgi:hypothetical protein